MILIKNGNIVLENTIEEMDLFISDKKIVKIGKSLPDKDCIIINAKGRYVLPGLIDMNCTLKDPGYEHKEDIESLSLSAVAGGYTTICCVPITRPVVDNKVVVEYVMNKIKSESTVDVKLYGIATKDGEEEKFSEISEMHKAGVIGICDGNKSIMNTYLFNNFLRYCEMFHLPIITFCEDETLKHDGLLHDGTTAVFNGLQGIPRESEEIIVARNLILGRDKDLNMHFTKISSKNSLNLIKFAKTEERKITCDCTIHHLFFTEDDVAGFKTEFKTSPPLRTKEDALALIDGIKKGIIDCIVSGHNPENIDTKRKEFEKASLGVSSLETSFLAGYNKLVLENHITMNKLADLYSKNPSKILNIDNVGEIKEGNIANILIFDPNQDTKMNSEYFYSKAKYSMFEDMTFKGRINTTIVNGKVVYKTK
ncbi:MAG: dihydroorotase [Lachnospirales bacterium]